MTVSSDAAIRTGQRQGGLPRIATFQHSRSSIHYLVYHYLVASIRRAALISSGRLLDIGCGNKPYRRLFRHVSAYVGCDIMQSSLSTVDVLCPADAIPLPDQSFDVVLCTQTIEHIANFPGVLREAYRLLRPGGLFFLSAPMYWHLHEEPYDFFRFTKYGLQVGLEQAGFDVEQVEPNGGKWSLLGLALLHTLPPRLTGWRWFTGFTNSLFLWLDQRQFDAVNTSNYFVTARRPHRDRAL